jgi:hydrogenase maturation protease
MRLVIGIGNPDRGDDGVGLAVARRVAGAAPRDVTVRELDGDQLRLLDAWEGADEVIVVDAVCSGGHAEHAGATYRFDASRPLGARFGQRGTHTFSLAEVIELARALRRLPPRLAGFGIEGATFALGTGLSPEVEAAADAVARQILDELTGGRQQCAWAPSA